jgi:uncharacterized Zn finger protein
MNCLRCAGLMVRDDLQDETGLERFAAWRCVICGEVLDPVILENRSAAPNLMVERGRHWPKECNAYQREYIEQEELLPIESSRWGGLSPARPSSGRT